MLHDAHFEAITQLTPHRVRAQAADSINVALKRIGVSVKSARIQDHHQPQIAKNLMPNRVPPHRRAYLHEKPPLILLVFLGMFAALLPAVAELPLRPIDPEIIPVPDQNRSEEHTSELQ